MLKKAWKPLNDRAEVLGAWAEAKLLEDTELVTWPTALPCHVSILLHGFMTILTTRVDDNGCEYYAALPTMPCPVHIPISLMLSLNFQFSGSYDSPLFYPMALHFIFHDFAIVSPCSSETVVRFPPPHLAGDESSHSTAPLGKCQYLA